ncbi:DNA translocase FtsK [compost metagenome]
MKLITNAIVFSAELPSIELMGQHLAEIPFEPVGEVFRSRAGFIANPITGELVTPIEGGFSFTVRLDEKILPKASVNQAVAEAVKARTEELERDLDEDETGAVAEATMTRLIANALIKTTVVSCFYSIADNFLIIPTTGKPLAQTVMALLIKATGSVKTATIHVDNIKGGLTTRLTNYLNGNSEAFDGFKLGETCNLKGEGGKSNFDMSNLDDARQGLLEGLKGDMQVELMELVHEGVSFKLTHDFKLRSIDFHGELTEDEEDQRDNADAAYLWRIEAATQLLQLVATIKALCDLFEYKRPELVAAVLPAKDADAVVTGDEPDALYDEAVAFVRESGRASISAVQRKLKIGYNRAARMIERMELDNVITPMNSNGSREVKI